MKKTLFLTLIVLCLVQVSSFAQKIGYLNTGDLLAQMTEVKKADTILAQYADELNKIYNGYIVEYQQKLADYQQNVATMSDVKKEYMEEELSQMQIRLSDFEKDSNDKLSKKKEDLYGPILEKVKNAIKLVGEENKLTAVMDGSALLYTGTDCMDILPMVKKKLNIQ
ncbi:MAG: OmpH family outer membrane protein [Chitinophagales bacterium]